MAPRKTLEEKIAAEEQRKARADAKLKQLHAKEKELERKARTHRLLSVGGAAEKYVSGITEEEMLSLMESVKGSSDYIDSDTPAEQLRSVDFSLSGTKSVPASEAEIIEQIVLDKCGDVDPGKFSVYVTRYTDAIKKSCRNQSSAEGRSKHFADTDI